MAVWAKVVGPLAGREVGDVERFGDHEAELWLELGVIVECDDPSAPVKVAPPVAKKVAAPVKRAAK
jgi:hypothetical protein